MKPACVAFVLFAASAIAAGQSVSGPIGDAPRPAAHKPAAPVSALKSWITFTDPNEGAFQLKLPAGWNNSGGTRRFDALQYRMWVVAQSPDGSTILDLGDANEPSYTLPMTGFAIGSIYNSGGAYYVVEPLQSAQQYAVTWGTRKLQSLCTDITTVSSRARPDVALQLAVISPAAPGMSQTFGEANFTCQRNGVAHSAYAFLGVTVLQTSASTALWYASDIAAFLAPTSATGSAADILARMVSSESLDPQWAARQSQAAVDVSEITARTNTCISNMIMREWEDRNATHVP